MSLKSANPIVVLISGLMDQVVAECRRLRDREPLVEYKKLVDTLFSIQRNLGTVAHEVAAADLKTEYKKAKPEAAQAWREIWRRFAQQREHAKGIEAHVRKFDSEAKAHIREVEESLKHPDAADDELIENLRDVLESMKQANAAGKRLSKDWRIGPWLLLWVDLSIYLVYVRYFAARLVFTVLRHAFIIVVAIAIFGIGYSKGAAALTEVAAEFTSAWHWVAGALVFASYLFKKYYVDAKVKKLQVRLEARWLFKVVLHIHMVRTLALLARTHSRRPNQA